jgi:antitoxin YefM
VYFIWYKVSMKSSSVSLLRRNLASTLDSVVDDHEPILVTREGGKSPVVILSLEDFASYEETEYLLRSPANAKRLKAAVKSLASGLGNERDLVE